MPHDSFEDQRLKTRVNPAKAVVRRCARCGAGYSLCESLRMLGIRFSKAIQDVPPDVVEKVRVMVVRVGRTLASLPPGSLDSSRDERFSFAIGTWRFEYRIDLAEHCLIVDVVAPARMASTG